LICFITSIATVMPGHTITTIATTTTTTTADAKADVSELNGYATSFQLAPSFFDTICSVHVL